jgi:hypothetical protein
MSGTNIQRSTACPETQRSWGVVGTVNELMLRSEEATRPPFNAQRPTPNAQRPTSNVQRSTSNLRKCESGLPHARSFYAAFLPRRKTAGGRRAVGAPHIWDTTARVPPIQSFQNFQTANAQRSTPNAQSQRMCEQPAACAKLLRCLSAAMIWDFCAVVYDRRIWGAVAAATWFRRLAETNFPKPKPLTPSAQRPILENAGAR